MGLPIRKVAIIYDLSTGVKSLSPRDDFVNVLMGLQVLKALINSTQIAGDHPSSLNIFVLTR